MESNGVDYDLLAPGSDLVCAQPGLDRLGNLLVGVYSGISIATAVVSGCIASLFARHGIRAGEDIAALSKPRLISSSFPLIERVAVSPKVAFDETAYGLL